MLDFQNPFAFLLLLLLPLYFVLKISGFFRRISFPLTFADWNGKPFDWNAKVRSFFFRIFCFAHSVRFHLRSYRAGRSCRLSLAESLCFSRNRRNVCA